jgi:hypothetical protein
MVDAEMLNALRIYDHSSYSAQNLRNNYSRGVPPARRVPPLAEGTDVRGAESTYKIGKPLGGGASGDVYDCRRLAENQEFAIKVVATSQEAQVSVD